tara:strand:+ start:1694 stop:2155 length:462 start_codon:yes stop_codon:yes gene_type:complete
MALTGKKYETIHNKTGDDLVAIKSSFDNNKHQDLLIFEGEAALIYQIQKMQDELDYLRTEIDANKNKASFPGLGTSSTTALAGDTALLAIGTSGSTALAGDTNIVTIGSSTTIAFGDMITKVTGKPPKTTTTYTIVMTVTNGGVSKSTTLTLT